MKGERTLSLNGEDLVIRFSFGAVEDFCEELDVDFGDWQEEVFNKPKNMRIFIYHAAKDQHDGIKKEDIRDLDFFEAMGKVTGLINESSKALQQTGNSQKGKGKK